MLNAIAIPDTHIPTMPNMAINAVREIEELSLTLPQIPLKTFHTIHAGMYARTIMVPAGTFLTGALIKIATLLIVSGKSIIYGMRETVQLDGYHVVPASFPRKQAVAALEDTHFTMLFPTTAKTVKEAEEQFTDEVQKLSSRSRPELNHTTITGE